MIFEKYVRLSSVLKINCKIFLSFKRILGRFLAVFEEFDLFSVNFFIFLTFLENLILFLKFSFVNRAIFIFIILFWITTRKKDQFIQIFLKIIFFQKFSEKFYFWFILKIYAYFYFSSKSSINY